MKTLKVFYVIHQRVPGSIRYKKIKSDMDFQTGTPEEAYAFLYKKYGRFAMDDRTNRAPDQWVEINSHTYFDPTRENILLPEERTFEVPLFSGKMLNECLMDSPNIGLTRKKRK